MNLIIVSKSLTALRGIALVVVDAAQNKGTNSCQCISCIKDIILKFTVINKIDLPSTQQNVLEKVKIL